MGKMGKMGKVASNGIGGSGIHGIFGSVVTCSSTDNSYYCNFTKFFNSLIMVLITIYVLYMGYTVLWKPAIKYLKK